MTTTVIDDTDPSIAYSPEWSFLSDAQNGYYNTSAHQTGQAGASLEMPYVFPSIRSHRGEGMG